MLYCESKKLGVFHSKVHDFPYQFRIAILPRVGQIAGKTSLRAPTARIACDYALFPMALLATLGNKDNKELVGTRLGQPLYPENGQPSN
jgi:hypothetical protein